MKITLRILSIVSLLAASAIAGETFTTIAGKKFENVTITRVEPDGLSLMTDDGIVKVRFAELDQATQTRFGYDPATAAAFALQVREATANREAREAAAFDQLRNAKSAEYAARDHANDLSKAPKTRIVGTVLTVRADGCTVTVRREDHSAIRAIMEQRRLDSIGREPTSAELGLGGPAMPAPHPIKKVPVFVKGLVATAGATVDVQTIAISLAPGAEVYEFVKASD